MHQSGKVRNRHDNKQSRQGGRPAAQGFTTTGVHGCMPFSPKTGPCLAAGALEGAHCDLFGQDTRQSRFVTAQVPSLVGCWCICAGTYICTRAGVPIRRVGYKYL